MYNVAKDEFAANTTNDQINSSSMSPWKLGSSRRQGLSMYLIFQPAADGR